MSSRGKLIVISAPSGGGKTTIAQEILARHTNIQFSVSATTRKKRENEEHGRDYFFLTRKEFEEKISQGELAEYEVIYGDYYGSLKSIVEDALAEKRPLLFDIDVNGALSIKRKYLKDTILIFIKPPSLEVLKERILKRSTEDEVTVRKRFERVPMELEKGKSFDYEVANDDLQKAINEVDEIVKKSIEDC
ncbi:MAG: guanylate kinase [Bacteroidota bacterium]